MQIPKLGARPIAESWDLTPGQSGTCDSLQNYRDVDSKDRSASAGLLPSIAFAACDIGRIWLGNGTGPGIRGKTSG